MMRVVRQFLCLGGAAALAAALFAPGAAAADPPPGLEAIKHIIVIYLENHSFDNLYGEFPGANGLLRAGRAAIQLDRDGKPYRLLPPVLNTATTPATPDARFPTDRPNRPFPIDRYLPIDQKTGDLVHRFYQEQAQIDGGKMDRFVAYSNAGGLTMGYYDISKTQLWALARRYTLADNYFHAAFGGSFLNHFWLICACTPRYPDPPPALVAGLDAEGKMVRDGEVTPNGFAVNTMFSVYAPHPPVSDQRMLLPPQDMTTIGDQLSKKGIGWAWYAGGWDAAIAGHPDPYFEYHHQPFVYFRQFADGTAAKRDHLKDEKDLLAAIAQGTLPPVAFWKPIGEADQHPGYADLVTGDDRVAAVIEKIRRSPIWRDAAIIVTYDENGGFWDHVAPPRLDQWGPGTRVPAIIISRFAKRNHVDHTRYDTTSILKLIEERFGLPLLNPKRENQVGDLSGAFRF